MVKLQASVNSVKEFIFGKVAGVQSETLLKIELLYRSLQLY